MQLGQIFGNWCVVDSRARRLGGYREVKVTCKVHGGEMWKSYDSLRKGSSSSCRQCVASKRTKYSTAIEKKLKVCHSNILGRCYNQNHPSYSDYGGRGILLSSDLRDCGIFVQYCLHLPGTGYEIDRINNERGYEIGNLRWANRSDQTRNTRSNVYVTYRDQKYCLSDFIRKHTYLSVSWGSKLYKQGYSAEMLACTYSNMGLT